MNFFSDRKKPVYFVTKNFNKHIDEKCDIVLSPEFYWVKKVTLNLKFSFEVKKMAPSIFDGVLPNGQFEYKVYKLSPIEYIIIAYDIQKILRDLERLDIDTSLVDKIYTAQNEFLENDITLRVDENFGIVSEDGVILFMPEKFLDTLLQVSVHDILKDKKLSSDYIYSRNFQRVHVSHKDSSLLLWLLVILVLLLCVNILKIQKDRGYISRQKESLIKSYGLPKTSFEIKSMESELSKIEIAQNRLKYAIVYLDKFQLKNGELFDSLKYRKNGIKLSIKLKDRKREDEFKKYISKNFKILKSYRENGHYTVEVKL